MSNDHMITFEAVGRYTYQPHKAMFQPLVGTFISNNVSRYSIVPPCQCGCSSVCVDDYTNGKVFCPHCKSLLFERFEDCIEQRSTSSVNCITIG